MYSCNVILRVQSQFPDSPVDRNDWDDCRGCVNRSDRGNRIAGLIVVAVATVQTMLAE